MDGRHLSLRKRLGLELYRRLHREAVERHELRTLFWECTLRCNLRCGHCGSDCTASPDCQDMPAEDFFRVLDRQITPRVDPHRVMVVLSGGEVLVRSDLERIGRALYDREYPWGMVTNGMALTPQRFDGLLAAGLHSMTVSIDGFEAEHNRLRRHPLSFARAAEAVRMAAAEADACERGVIVQDTAWEGYEKIPSWIMEGYGTMASEAAEQLREMAINRPTHVFVQAGVGSLAGAVVGYFTNLYPDNPPTFVVVECAPAACLYKGAAAGDGDPRIVDGDMPSIMAGLCCGEPNILGWDILRNHATAFVSCPDWVTARGMRTLGAPEKGDPRVISGESGAVTTGLVETLMLDPEYAELKELIGLDKTSSVLCFSTEGDTDPDQYRRIVWEGEYPTC